MKATVVPRAKLPAVVKLRGVRYVPEDPAITTRRESERRQRVYAKRLSIATAERVSRGGPYKPSSQQDASLHHHVMPLSGGINYFEFEGSLVLPPKRVETQPGKGAMIVFMVGRVPTRGRGYRKPHKTLLYVNAYGDLANDILARYRWKDHVRIAGIFTSITRYGRPVVTVCCQRIELLARHSDNADLDDSNTTLAAKLQLEDSDDAENDIIDAIIETKRARRYSVGSVDGTTASNR